MILGWQEILQQMLCAYLPTPTWVLDHIPIGPSLLHNLNLQISLNTVFLNPVSSKAIFLNLVAATKHSTLFQKQDTGILATLTQN